jgi:hypothetical protein
MPLTDIHSKNEIEATSEGHHTNITGVTSGDFRGLHISDQPVTAIKTITPASDTDVNFAHRYLYTGDGGDVAVRFESGGTAYTFTLPAGGLLPINLYSIDSFTGSDIHLFR